MKREIKDIRALLERWYETQTTDAEERELREWFLRAGKLPADLDRERVMFVGFAALSGEKTNSRRRVGRVAVWIAAAVVFIGVVFAAAYIRPYGYINGHAVRDAEVAMQTMVYLEKLEAFDRSMQIIGENNL